MSNRSWHDGDMRMKIQNEEWMGGHRRDDSSSGGKSHTAAGLARGKAGEVIRLNPLESDQENYENGFELREAD